MLHMVIRGTLVVLFISQRITSFLFFIVSSCSYAGVLLGDHPQLRQLAQAQPTSTITSESSVKQQPIYLDFDERLVVSFVLHSQMQELAVQNSINKRLRQILTDKLLIPIETIEVKNFEEFIEKSKAEWPDTSSLAQDLEIISSQPVKPLKKFISHNPRIQKKINEYRKYKAEYYKNLLLQKSKENVLDVELLAYLASLNSDLQKDNETIDAKKYIQTIKGVFSHSSQSVFTKLIANLDQNEIASSQAVNQVCSHSNSTN